MKVLTLRWHTLLLGVMDSGLAGKIGTADFPAPRNDVEGQLVTQYHNFPLQ